MGNILKAVLVSLVEVLIGIPANHWVSSVVVHRDGWVVLLVLAAFDLLRSGGKDELYCSIRWKTLINTSFIQFPFAKPELGSVDGAGVELQPEHRVSVSGLGSPVIAFDHDVTLQQQSWFDGHTQSPSSSALKVIYA